MNLYRVSDAARSDLDEIWFYLAQDNVDTADGFIHAITSSFPALASTVHMGRQREDLSPRLRSFSMGNHVIFYRPMKHGVEIAHVLHGTRDFPPLFE
jgi:toxin ParE1/3/4